MTRTLILLFHPDIANSRANAALAGAASRLPGVEVVDLHALYPDGAIDDDREAARLLSADRIVLQFPLQWYSTPLLLKAWQDRILTRMFYIDYEAEGRCLEGKPVMVAVTADNTAEAYGPGGRNRYPLPELLRPLEATAARCGLPWAEPFVVFEANRLEAAALEVEGRRYAERLAAWIAPSAPTPPAPRPKTRAATPMALSLSTLAIPAVVLIQWLLAREATAIDPGVWNWPAALGAALMLPIVWIFVQAMRAARGSGRSLRPALA